MRFLQGCLQRDDLVIPAGDGFLVIYAQTPGRDFESETETIRSALNAFYLGESATSALKAEVKHARVDSRGLVRLIGKTDDADAPVPHDPRRHEFSFVPVWSAKKEAVTGYWIAPIYRTHGGRRYGYDGAWAESQVSSDADYLSLDLAIISSAVREAERSLVSGRRCLICYSVHSTTMQNRQRRREFLNLLYTTPENLRPYLLGRIAEIEPGTPTVTMAEWVHQLRPVSSRVTIELHESDRALSGLDSVGASSVSFTLSPNQHDAEGREGYGRHIARWSAALQRQKISFRLDNVIESTLLKLAVSSGVDFITSDRIWPTVSGPKGVRLFSSSDLRAALAASSD